jgi:hypothetical protein
MPDLGSDFVQSARSLMLLTPFASTRLTSKLTFVVEPRTWPLESLPTVNELHQR